MTSASNAPPAFIEVTLPPDEKEAERALQPYIESFHLHPLTVEDCIKRNQRCKLETYDGYLFLVWHMYTPSQEEHHELQLCIRSDALLAVAEGLPPDGQSWREYLIRNRANGCNLKQTLTAILDRLVDEAEDHLEVLRDGAADLEADILARDMDPGEILYLKRLVRQFARSMRSAQPLFGQIVELVSHLPGVPEFTSEEKLRLRNVTDHMMRLLEATQQLDGLMATLMDVHWGAMGARTNRQMQRLTTIATVFLPVGFWSGLFGMNFETMPFKEPWFFAAGMGALGLTWIIVLFYMRRRGAFDHVRLDHRGPLFPPRQTPPPPP